MVFGWQQITFSDNAHTGEHDMSAHTPGPWESEETEHRISSSHWIMAGEHQSICIGAIIHFSGEHAQSDANARLIAAAPDLLKACKVILDHIGKECTAPHRQTLLSAIAKAEGATT